MHVHYGSSNNGHHQDGISIDGLHAHYRHKIYSLCTLIPELDFIYLDGHESRVRAYSLANFCSHRRGDQVMKLDIKHKTILMLEKLEKHGLFYQKEIISEDHVESG